MSLLLWLALQDAEIQKFVDAMKAAKTDDERIAAVTELARTRHLKVDQKLVQVAGGPYSADVKIAACRAIRDPKAGPGLQQVLNSYGALLGSENPKQLEEQRVVEAIVRALGDIRDKTATPRLVQIITKNNIPLIREAVLAMARTRDAGAVEQLVRLYRAAITPETSAQPNSRKPLIDITLKALRWITGQKFAEADEWEKWWRAGKGSFQPPPEETLSGLPPGTASFCVYTGKGDIEKLARYDLVILRPGNHTKEELARLRLPIADGGDVQAALDGGFRGVLVDPSSVAETRKKFPKAIVLSRGPDRNAHAALIDSLDPKKPDAEALKKLRDLIRRDAVDVLALFVQDKDGEALARANGFLGYVAPAKALDRLE